MSTRRRRAACTGPALIGCAFYPAGLALVAFLTFAPSAAAARLVFRNTVNRPFAAVANGPVGAVTISLDRAGRALSWADRDALILRALREQHSPESLAAAVSMVRYLQRHGGIHPRFVPRFPRAAVFTYGGKPVFDVAGRLASRLPGPLGGGSLGEDLVFDPLSFLGFGEREALEQLFDDAKPVINAIYGLPAENITLRVVELPAGTTPPQGGLYIPGNPGEIRLGRFLDVPANDPGNLFAFLVLLVRAYHNTAMIDFDSWEEGFARTVATKVWQQIRPGFPIELVHSFVMVPQYDSLNQPPLGTPTFFQPIFTGMLLPRISTAVTAWAKCLAQDPNFFKNFNEAYYSAFAPSLPGDTPALRNIAASVLPTIEGTSFYDWYLRQWVLDTSTHSGQQFYYIGIPLQRAQGDEPDEFSLPMMFVKYVADADAIESPVGGTVNLRYANFDRSVPDFFVPEGNTAVIPSAGQDAGLGFISPSFFPQNVGNTGQEGNGGRVFIDVNAGGFFATLLFPYTGPGDESDPNDFYGVLTRADDGQVRVTPPTGPPVVMDVDEGLFAGQVTGGDLLPGSYLLEYFPPGSASPTVQRVISGVTFALNVIVDADGITSATFDAPDELLLMSVPFCPTLGGRIPADSADVLGIPRHRLTMAQWRPDLPGAIKYRFYPDVSAFAPGLGFWLKPDGPIVGREIAGVAAPSGQPFVMHIAAGWSNIGYPFNSGSSLPVGSLLVAEGDPGINLENALPWVDAVAAGIVEGSIYDFDVNRVPQTDIAMTLERWKGYWIRCLRAEGCQLIFPWAGGLSTGKSRRATGPPADDWQMMVVAQSAGRSSAVRLAANSIATDGYDPGLDSFLPPASPGQSVIARIVSEPGSLFKDTRPASAASTWDLEISSLEPFADVTVTWPELTRLPRGLSAFLVDRDAGVRRAMRTTRAYTFNSGAAGQTRHLSIEVRPADVGALTVTNVVTSPTRGGGISIGFELSRAAAAEVTVFNLAGRRVRLLQPKAEMLRGPNFVTWDLRSDFGT
ncbi:MAG: hypothetical protein ACE5O2_06015, partial [Armatimonadota bacterium]